MSTREAMSHAALGWVKPELDQTLLQMRQLIQDHVEAPGDAQPMAQVAAWLHQVRGTLRMVELYAPAMVAEELELLAQAVAAGQVADAEEGCAILMRGTVLLPDYLERLQNGHRDIPIVLLPLLNEIRAARGAEGLSESVLLDFGPAPADVSADELEHARGSLAGRNRQLLETVGGVVKEELLRIKDALDLHLRTGAPASALQTQVNELGAVADTLAMMGLEAARELVLGQRDALVQVVASGQNIDEDLLLEIAGALLYVDASLDDQVSSLGTSGHEEDPVTAETRRTVEVLAGEAITNFAHAREHFVAFIETNWDHARLTDVPRLLGDVAGALRILDMDEPAQYVTGVQRYIDNELIGRQRIPSGRQLDTLADAMASLEYFLEGVRERRPGGAEILEISRSSLEALRYWPLPAVDMGVTSQLAAPAQAPAAVAGVQESAIATAAGTETGTASVEVAVSQVALEVPGSGAGELPVTDADSYPYVFAASYQPVAESTSLFDPVVVESPLQDPTMGLEIAPLQLEPSADALPEPAGDAGAAFDPALAEWDGAVEPAVEIVGLDPALRIDDADGEDTGTDAPAYSGRGEGVENELRDAGLLDSGFAHEPVAGLDPAMVAGAVVVTPQELDWNEEEAALLAELSRSAEDLPQADAPVPASAEQATAGPVAAVIEAGFQDNGLTVDSDTQEIREVFLEEFDEELGNLRRMLPGWRANPGDMATLLPVRRVFHTLKGSGRLVGATTLGEFSWAIEGMLNRVRDGQRPATPAVVALVGLAVDEVLPQLYAALHDNSSVRADLLAIQAVAERVAAGEEVHYVPRPAAAVAAVADIAVAPLETTGTEAAGLQEEGAGVAAAPDVAEGTPAAVDSVLLDILQAEVTTHLATLRGWLAACQLEPQPVDEPLLRAVHTMSGAFAMTDVPEITAVTGPAEALVKRLLAAGITPGIPAIAALSAAAVAVADTLEALQHEQPMIPRFAALGAQLQAEVDRLPEARHPLAGNDDTWAVEEMAGEAIDELPELAADTDGPLLPELTGSADLSAYVDADMGLQLPDAGDIDAMIAAAERNVPQSAAPVVPPPLPPELPALPPLPGEDEAEASAAEAAEAAAVEAAAAEAAAAEAAAAEAAAAEAAAAEAAAAEAAAAEAAAAEAAAAEAAAAEAAAAEAAAAEAAAAEAAAAEAAAAEAVETETESLRVPHFELEAPFNAGAIDAGLAAVEPQAADSQPSAALDMQALDMELVDIFVEEGADLLDHCDGLIAALRQDPLDREALAGLQRDLHTLKGGARMAGINPVGDLAHSIESLLEAVAGERVVLGDSDIRLLETGFDRLHQMVTLTGRHQAVELPQALVDALEARTQGGAGDALADLVTDAAPAGGIAAEAVEAQADAEAVEAEAVEAVEAVEADADADADADTAEAEAVEAEVEAETVEAEAVEAEVVKAAAAEVEAVEAHAEADAVEVEAVEAEAVAAEAVEAEAVEGEAVEAEAVEAETEAVEAEAEAEIVKHEAVEAEAGPVADLEDAATLAGAGIVTIAGLLALDDAEAPAAAAIEDDAPQDVAALADLQPAADTAADAAAADVAGDAAAAAAVLVPEPSRATAVALEPLSEPVDDAVVEGEEGPVRAGQEQVRVRADLLDRLVGHAGEVAIYRSRLEQQLGAFRSAMAELDRTNARLRDQLRRLDLETEAQIVARYQREQDQADRTFDPLELDRFSTLQQLSRALNESAADLSGLQGVLDDLARNYDNLLMQQSRVSSELQDGLMRARMVPFEGLVPRLRRVVRQAASDTGKQVRLVVEGTQGELDRNVLDRMVAPLEHMLRNSVAHGIEAPAARAAAGKPEEGVITLQLRREGSEIALEVADDGAGLDRAAIRRRAEQRGLISADVELSDHELDSLIFASGFSTADQVSQLAGRGVGMDVVRNEVRQLGGSVDISSEFGRGARFVLRLPQTLAVTQAVFAQIGETTYAVPVASVSGIGRIARERFESGDGIYRYGGEEYALYDMGLLVGQGPAKAEGQAQIPLLLVRAGDLRAAVAIDQVVGNREVVVKPVGMQIASVPGIYGATITGDGQVVVILDVAPLVRRLLSQPDRKALAAAPAPARQVPLVMVVDDSLTMRKVTGRVLERHNFEVAAARDGIEALEQLEERVPDLMLLDIEMPRMDGYELATAMRADARYRNVPIIMITSRTGDKHRQRALEIGVQRYLGKPYQEPELMRNVYDLLGISRVRD